MPIVKSKVVLQIIVELVSEGGYWRDIDDAKDLAMAFSNRKLNMLKKSYDLITQTSHLNKCLRTLKIQ